MSPLSAGFEVLVVSELAGLYGARGAFGACGPAAAFGAFGPCGSFGSGGALGAFSFRAASFIMLLASTRNRNLSSPLTMFAIRRLRWACCTSCSCVIVGKGIGRPL